MIFERHHARNRFVNIRQGKRPNDIPTLITPPWIIGGHYDITKLSLWLNKYWQ